MYSILVLAGIVTVILLNPQARESNSEIETLRQQMRILRQLCLRFNRVMRLSFKDLLERKCHAENIIQELQLQVNVSIQELEMKTMQKKRSTTH